MRTISVGLLVICCGLMAQAQAPDHPFTLREAVDMLRQRNFVLAAGRAHLVAVRNQETTAALRPNPVFSSANEDFRPEALNRTAILNTQEFTQNISQLFERGGKRRIRVENARLGTTVARDQYNDNQRQLELQLKNAFVTMLLAKANLELAHGNRADYGKVIELNRVRVQAGDISPTDFDRIRLQQAQFESDLLTAQLNLTQSRMQLGALLGLEPSATFDIAGELRAPELLLELADLQKSALANRPDYAAALHAVAKAESDVRLAYANGITDVTVGTEYKRNGPDNTFGLTFSVPVRVFDRNQGEKLRTQNELAASRLNEQAVRMQVMSDVAQAWTAYQAALERSRLYSQQYLQLAQTVRERTQFSFQNAGTTLLDYLDAVRSFRDVQLASRTADAQLLTTIHQLSFVTGTELMP